MKNKIRGQNWTDCDKDIKGFIKILVTRVLGYLGNDLTGIYLHGSLAMESYYRPKSDIDLLVVVKSHLPEKRRKILANMFVEFSDIRPTVGDIEISVIQEKYAKKFVHPMPYELHYGSELKEKILKGEIYFSKEQKDSDLAAHCMVTKKKGVCLYGKPVSKTFGNIPWDIYLEAVMYDINWILKNDNILKSPFYGVLNLCRMIQLLTQKKRTVVSKKEGTIWCLSHLPKKYKNLIQKSLTAYISNRHVTSKQRRTAGIRWNAKELKEFRDFAKKGISRLKNIHN